MAGAPVETAAKCLTPFASERGETPHVWGVSHQLVTEQLLLESALRMSRHGLVGRDEFLELGRTQGVLEVARLAPGAIQVFLRRALPPDEARSVRRLAEDWWPLDHIVISVRADRGELGNAKQAIERG